MRLTDEEIMWLNVVKATPEKYYLVIGSNNVYVYDIIEKKVAFQFEFVGTAFAVALLNSLGYNADFA